jgi:hypothetical protein
MVVMSIELISKVQTAGTNSVSITNIPNGYKQLLVIGSYAGPGSQSCYLEFGNGNASDYIWSNVNYAQTSTSGSTSYGAYGGHQMHYEAAYTTAQIDLQLRPIIIRLQRYGSEVSTNEAIEYTIFASSAEVGNGGGAIEYMAGKNQNQSGTGFRTMRFRLTNSQNFASGTIFSLYGYL